MASRSDPLAEASTEALVLMQLQYRLDALVKAQAAMLEAIAGQSDDIERLRQAVESPRERTPVYNDEGRITHVTERVMPGRQHRPAPPRPRRVEVAAPVPVDAAPLVAAVAELAEGQRQQLADVVQLLSDGLDAIGRQVAAIPTPTDVRPALREVARSLDSQIEALVELREAMLAPRHRVPYRDTDGRILFVEDRPVKDDDD